LFAFLVGNEQFASSLIVEQHGSAGALFEVVGRKLLEVDEAERESVGERGAEFLHQVERERRASRAQGVKVADLGVEPDAFERANIIVSQHAVDEGQQGVEAVAWGTAGAGVHAERLALGASARSRPARWRI